MERIHGIIPAVFTPLQADGKPDLPQIKPLTDFLIAEKTAAFYVCGSTGEGPLLTTEERQRVTESYVDAVGGRVPVIVQVGHNSTREACALAVHAAQTGADAISAVPPHYFKLDSLSKLIACMAEIAGAAPDLPFYYYHIPGITGVNFDMAAFLIEGQKSIPNLRGIKHSTFTVFEMQHCIEIENRRFELLFGSDEMLLSALVAGAEGAVGTTYNFAAPLFNSIINAFKAGDLGKARTLQYNAVKMVRVLYEYGGLAAMKATMALIGMDCGSILLPHQNLAPDAVDALKNDLDAIGFFSWGRHQNE